MRVIALIVLCAFIVAAFGKQKFVPNAKTNEFKLQKEKACADTQQSLFSPFRCVDETEDLEGPGKDFLAKNQVNDFDPIIFLPGIGGSGLEAKLDKDTTPAWYCFKKWDWFRIWFATEELLAQKCWMANLEMDYNVTSKTYMNTPGVEVRPADFGGLKGVEYLDYKFGIPISLTGVYAKMIKSMLAVGYKKDVNLRGAPYDWRLPAHVLKENGWFDQLEALIVDTYTKNGNRPVHIVSHSMGCPTALAFMNTKSIDWLNTYVKSFIPIAGPWSGAAKALRAAISGDNFGLNFAEIEIVKKKALRAIARDAGGLVQLVPDNILWTSDTVFVSSPTRNYTAQDYVALFTDIGAPDTAEVWEDVNTLNELKPPGIQTYCIYGYGVPTEISYYYANGWENDPEMNMSDLGDGTVPLDSLRQCEVWDTQQGPAINVTKFNLIKHGDIIKDPDVIQFVLSLTTRKV